MNRIQKSIRNAVLKDSQSRLQSPSASNQATLSRRVSSWTLIALPCINDELIPSKSSLSLQEMQNRQQHGMELFSIIAQQPPHQQLLCNPSNWCILLDAICFKQREQPNTKQLLSWLDDRAQAALKHIQTSDKNGRTINVHASALPFASQSVLPECLTFIKALGYQRQTDTLYVLTDARPTHIKAARAAINNTLKLMSMYDKLTTYWKKCKHWMGEHKLYKQHKFAITISEQPGFATNYGDYHALYRRLLPISYLQIQDRDDLVLQALHHLGIKLKSLPSDQSKETRKVYYYIHRIYEKIAQIEKFKNKTQLTNYYRATTLSQMESASHAAPLSAQLTTDFCLTTQQLEQLPYGGLSEFNQKIVNNLDVEDRWREALNRENWALLIRVIALNKDKPAPIRIRFVELLEDITHTLLLNEPGNYSTRYRRISFRSNEIQKFGNKEKPALLPALEAFLSGLGYVKEEKSKDMVLSDEAMEEHMQVIQVAASALEHDYKGLIILQMLPLRQRWYEVTASTLNMLDHPIFAQQHGVLADIFKQFTDCPVRTYHQLLPKCVAVCHKMQDLKELSDEQKRERIPFELLQQFGIENYSMNQQEKNNDERMDVLCTYLRFVYTEICKIEEQRRLSHVQLTECINPKMRRLAKVISADLDGGDDEKKHSVKTQLPKKRMDAILEYAKKFDEDASQPELLENEGDAVFDCCDIDELNENDSLRNIIYQSQVEEYEMHERCKYLPYINAIKQQYPSLQCEDNEDCKWKLDTVPINSLSSRQFLHVKLYHADDYTDICRRRSRSRRFSSSTQGFALFDDEDHDDEEKQSMCTSDSTLSTMHSEPGTQQQTNVSPVDTLPPTETSQSPPQKATKTSPVELVASATSQMISPDVVCISPRYDSHNSLSNHIYKHRERNHPSMSNHTEEKMNDEEDIHRPLSPMPSPQTLHSYQSTLSIATSVSAESDLDDEEELGSGDSDFTQPGQADSEGESGQSTQPCPDGDQCSKLTNVLSLCKEVKQTQLKCTEDIDHCIEFHGDRKLEKECKCGLKQGAFDKNNPYDIARLHVYFYHDLNFDDGQEDEKEDPDEMMTDRVNEEEEEKAAIEYKVAETETKEIKVVEFGHPFVVLNESEAKFKNPKQEMMNNEYKQITKKEWNDLLKQCVVFSKSGRAKLSALSVKEIVALKLYTDFDDLQREFRQCFRETNEQKRIERQKQFWHWNDLLEKTCRKSHDVISKKLYHGISKGELAASTFSGTYWGPVSTTTDIAVARTFAGKTGQILELFPSFGAKGLRVSWLSNFPDEDEVLYMNVSFQILDIIQLRLLSDADILLPIQPQSFNMEHSVLNALRTINPNSKILSLNEEKEIGDESEFGRLQTTEKFAVLYLLYLQYRPKEWNDLIQDSNQSHLANTLLKFRDQFITLAQKVEAVSMDNMCKLLQMFFYSKSADFTLPILDKNTDLQSLLQSMENKYVANQPFYFSRIVKLFPAAQQIALSADNFDWSLNRLIDFLDSYHSDFHHIALQDIHIRRIEPGQASQRLADENVRRKLHILQKYGWRFITSIHLHRAGFEPLAEIPFLRTFLNYKENADDDDDEEGEEEEKKDDSTPKIRLLSRTHSLKIMQPNIATVSNEQDEQKVNVNEVEGVDAITVDYNPSNCTLTKDIFQNIQYKQKLVELLLQRKEENLKSSANDNSFKSIFVSECEAVESLVLNPMPRRLYAVFCENYDAKRGKLKSKPIISLETVTKIFPNLTDLFLQNTRFTPRECNRFVDFVKKRAEKKTSMSLQRIFYSKKKKLYERDVKKVQFKLKEIGWKFIESQQMIEVDPKLKPTKNSC